LLVCLGCLFVGFTRYRTPDHLAGNRDGKLCRLEPLVLSEAERRTLSNWARRRSTAQGLALRARIVLEALRRIRSAGRSRRGNGQRLSA
jgi:hypothetical protein